MNNLIRRLVLVFLLVVHLDQILIGNKRCNAKAPRKSEAPRIDFTPRVRVILEELTCYVDNYMKVLSDDNDAKMEIALMIPENWDDDIYGMKKDVVYSNVSYYFDEIVSEKFLRLVNEMTDKDRAQGQNESVRRFWQLVKKNIEKPPFNMRKIQLTALAQSTLRDILKTAIDFWCEEMEYKFVDSEHGLIDDYRLTFENDLEFFEQFYEEWEKLKVVNQETGLGQTNPWQLIQAICRETMQRFEKLLRDLNREMELGLEKEQMHDLAEQLLAPQDQMKILHYDHAYKPISQLEFSKLFRRSILEALKKPREDGNKIKQELRVDPVPRPNVKEWFKRSLGEEGLIPNGHRERYRIEIVTLETCSADSVLQALIWQYIDDDRFRKFIDELIRKSSDADLARFLAISAQEGNMKYIRCCDSVPTNVIALVPQLFSAMISTSTCKCQIERKFDTLPINSELVIIYGLRILQHAINDCFQGERNCDSCGKGYTENHVFGGFVFIIVALYTDDLHRVKEVTDIPQTIDLNGEQYELTCFSDLRMEKHAMMICRRMDGEWYQYDDNEKTAKPASGLGETLTDVLMYRKSA